MIKAKASFILLALTALLVGCGKEGSVPPAPSGNGESAPAAPTPASSGNAISFVDTQEGKPLIIDAALFDTPAAKEFLATGKNPYVGNEEAVAKGKKVFQMYSCTQCHGPEAKGQVGPGLTGPSFRYPKNATNKGMFETIWHGTNGGMGAKGVGLMVAGDNTQGVTVDEMLKIIAWVRSMSGSLTGNE